MRNHFIRLLIVLALVIHQGCAHITGLILSESIQEDMQRIAVMVKEEQEESLQDSRQGWAAWGKGRQEARWWVVPESCVI
jgi:hypothetical protein